MTTPAFHNNGLTQVLVDLLEEVRLSVDKDVNGADLLYSLLSTRWFKALLRVYECLLEHRRTSPSPYLTHASGLSQEILGDMRVQVAPSTDVQQLCTLLRGSHFQALLSAHDSVALGDYGPVLPPLPDRLPEDEEAIRIVCLMKNKQPLGATIKKDEVTGEILIARVIHGGLADRSGLLHAGDKLLEMNGEPVEGLEPEQVIQILTRSEGTVVFKVIPNPPQCNTNQETLYVRAMVDYNPLKDPSIPCPAAGLAFRRGNLLEIVCQTDAHWWQARQLHNTNTCAGLVPSTSQFKSRLREFWWSQPYRAHTCIKPLTAADVGEEEEPFEEEDVESDGESLNMVEEDEHGRLMNDFYTAGFRHSLLRCRRRAHSTRRRSCASCHSASSSPYEEILTYQRSITDPPRLIVLMGPSGVGVNELRRTLIKLDPRTFQGPVSHTTRPLRGDEVSGWEYHFITTEMFQLMISNHKFIEYGEYNRHLYGTCVDSVKDVLDNGKICVIDVEPHCLHAVRTKELKPYVIFVKPPSVERMRLTRRDPNLFFKRAFKDEDFKAIQDAGRIMEAQYSQFFDSVIVNDRLQEACMDLLTSIQHAQEQEQWVPASWISFDEP